MPPLQFKRSKHPKAVSTTTNITMCVKCGRKWNVRDKATLHRLINTHNKFCIKSDPQLFEDRFNTLNHGGKTANGDVITVLE